MREICQLCTRISAQGMKKESIRFQGSCSFLDRLFFGLWPEAWIPASKRLLPLFIEHPRPDLQQQMRSALAPLHLLQLHHSLAHHSSARATNDPTLRDKSDRA